MFFTIIIIIGVILAFASNKDVELSGATIAAVGVVGLLGQVFAQTFSY